MTIRLASIVFSGFLTLLAGCAGTGTGPAPGTQPVERPPTPETLGNTPLPPPEEPVQYANFPEEILTRVILAEMAGQRGMNQQALSEYISLARETQDVNIIKRAARVATFLRNTPASIEMSLLWLEHEPKAAEAHQTLALQMVSQNRFQEALGHFIELEEQGLPVDYRLLSGRIAMDSGNVTIRQEMISQLKDLRRRFPDNDSIQLALAHLYRQNDQFRLALEEMRQLARKTNDDPEIVLLEIQLLEQLGEDSRANRRLQQTLRSHPDHKQMRFLYARKLVEERKYREARNQFATIVEQYPDDFDMLYSLALISMEINLYSDARRYLETLVENGNRLDDAHFYLGFLSEQDNSTQRAIQHYMQVKAGSNFLQAQRNLTELMVKAGRYPEMRERLQTIRYTNPDYNIPLLSLEASILMEQGYMSESASILDSAITAFPNDVQLLYLRSVLHQENNDLDAMERDLRRMIQLNPESPVAYNTLGYTLADRTTRYEEAYELIKRAIELAPDDPAIIDSLGWVQYRLGMLEEARKNLERAFELYPDHEVAAHLGEVLWVMGERDKANRIWRDALKDQPDSEFIQEAIKRLNAGS